MSMPATKYAYEALLAEHKLTPTDLPEEAKLGIQQIKAIENVLSMQEKKAVKNGKPYKPSAATEKKIKAFDKWIVREILDYVEDKNSNADAPPVAAAAIIEDIKKDEPNTPPQQTPGTPPAAAEPINNEDPKGVEIDKELLAMFKAGKVEVDLAELKILAPTAYSVVFETYEKGGENGIETSHFLLRENNEKLNLTKK